MTFTTTRRLSVLLAAAAAAPALGQSLPWNRQIDEVAIAETPGSPGQYDIHVLWSASIGPTSTPLDLSTIVAVFVNGTEVPVAQIGTDIQVDAGSGFCGGGPPCGGGCGTGYIDGINAAAFLCLDDCECRLPSLTATLPPQPLVPEDEIMVLLMPASGAMPEIDETDDFRALTFGGPRIWDRGILSVELEPAAGAPDSFFDIWIEAAAQWDGFDGPLDLGGQLDLEIDGVVVASQALGGLASPASGGDISCGGAGCGNLCGWWNGLQVNCDEAFWHFGCMCGGGWISAFPGVEVEPGAQVKVILRPAPGALPELPGFPDNDEGDGELPNPCPADVTGDGLVNVDDLVAVILDWGCVDPEGNCAGDVNGDGEVNVDDLVEAILAWGACFPV